jgi:putative ATPase
MAYKHRPTELEGFVGHDYLFKKYPFLMQKHWPCLVLHGPPGSGKTTLAHILAARSGLELFNFNAVMSGVPELKKLIQSIIDSGTRALIFIDEIHRFNKSAQDALLPYLEIGTFQFIGATTEHPKQALNKALISRVQLIELKHLEKVDIEKILENTKTNIEKNIISFIAEYAGGDARKALNLLEIVSENSQLTFDEIQKIVRESSRSYDKNEDRHYDVISSFIKSMRGSNPDAAILYLAIMLDGGEDPVFIARRLMIFASEDVGNADPSALTLAVSGLQSVEKIGMPEARIILAQVTTYLASTVKSNATYNAINEALEFVKESPTIDVPDHLKSFPPKGAASYKYPHSYPGHFVEQEYASKKIPVFYRPTENGREKAIKDRLSLLWKK